MCKHLQIMICMNGNVNEFKRKRREKKKNIQPTDRLNEIRKKGEQIRMAKYCLNKIPSQWSSFNLMYFISNFILTYLYLFLLHCCVLCVCNILRTIHFVCQTNSIPWKYTRENVFIIIDSKLFALSVWESLCLCVPT